MPDWKPGDDLIGVACCYRYTSGSPCWKHLRDRAMALDAALKGAQKAVGMSVGIEESREGYMRQMNQKVKELQTTLVESAEHNTELLRVNRAAKAELAEAEHALYDAKRDSEDAIARMVCSERRLAEAEQRAVGLSNNLIDRDNWIEEMKAEADHIPKELAEAEQRANELDEQHQGVWVLFAKAERRAEEAEKRAATAEERARDHHKPGSCVTCMHTESERDEALQTLDESEAEEMRMRSEPNLAVVRVAELRAALEAQQWPSKPCVECGQRTHYKRCSIGRALASDGSAVSPDLLERLADREHERWSRWMKYLFTKGHMHYGTFVIEASSVERWRLQMEMPYNRLTEAEKESDRKEAREILETLGRSDGSAVATPTSAVMEILDKIVGEKEPWSYRELVQAVRRMREEWGE